MRRALTPPPLLPTLMLSFMLTLAGLVCPVQAQAAELTISAAASLTNAFNELKTMFEQDNPGVTLVMNYAASGPLFKQMQQGAPVDVFASANQRFMDQARQEGLIVAATRKDFVANDLVLAVPAGNPGQVATLDSLKSPAVKRVGAGNPDTVPAGQYAKGALAKAGLWDELQPKLVLGESVRQVLDYLRRAEVEAGLVYATDAIQGGPAVTVALTVPESLLPSPVTYPVAVAEGSKNKELAAKFVDLLVSERGKGVLKAKGFRIP